MTNWRTRYTAFIERHEVAWELSFGMLALAFVVTGFVEGPPWIIWLDFAITMVFLAEFATRLVAAPDRRAHLRGHWVDAFALIPAFRGFRLLRLLRLFRLVRTFAGVYRAMGHFERIVSNRGVLLLVFVWAAVVVITSLAFYAAESEHNPNVTTPFDALWWGIVTLTTVGYGDVLPVTPEGRIAAIVLMVLGIALFSAITGTVVAALVGGEGGNRSATSRLDELDALRASGRVDETEYVEKRATILEEL